MKIYNIIEALNRKIEWNKHIVCMMENRVVRIIWDLENAGATISQMNNRVNSIDEKEASCLYLQYSHHFISDEYQI